jgi:hypothetical protein
MTPRAVPLGNGLAARRDGRLGGRSAATDRQQRKQSQASS